MVATQHSATHSRPSDLRNCDYHGALHHDIKLFQLFPVIPVQSWQLLLYSRLHCICDILLYFISTLLFI